MRRRYSGGGRRRMRRGATRLGFARLGKREWWESGVEWRTGCSIAPAMGANAAADVVVGDISGGGRRWLGPGGAVPWR
uniref:Uncharacterized protein n=1 Tax=Oryza sativa subsp. japonica TaxID=39947 RepID=Q5Z853_ORYSJ|nr:hypothetical protein [Oryza sativa Japonica Group]